MRKHMQCGIIGVPFRTIEVVAVLRQRSQVDYAKHAAVIWPRISIVRCGFAQIIETGPNKLTNHPWQIVVSSKVEVGNIRPIAILQVIRRALVIIVHSSGFAFHREHIHATRRNCGCRFRAKNDVLRQFFICLAIALHLIVIARDIEGCRKTVVSNGIELVHATGHGASRVLTMANILQEVHFSHAIRSPLAGHLVAHAPHHHRRIVAIVVQHVHHVFFSPFVEYRTVTVLAFRTECPVVERLNHHHETHLVAQFHQLRCRHVMRRADGIASHIF